MKLEFDIYKRNRYTGVNIWYRTADEYYEESGREYLTEIQYSKINQWCSQVFNTEKYRLRVRRMAYADFWFASSRDADWFILYWSGIDSENI